MTLVERSIDHYRNFFKFLVSFTLIGIIVAAIILGNYDYKVMAVALPIFTFWMSVPIIWNYKNWKFMEKNKIKLEFETKELNIAVDKKFILSLNSFFTKIK
jgi:hypothetical protein